MIKDMRDQDGEVFTKCDTKEDFKEFCKEAQYPYYESEAEQVLGEWFSLIGNHIYFFEGCEEELTPIVIYKIV